VWIAAAPNGSWQTAQQFGLGQTIFGSDDERPYAPSKSEDGYAAMLKGFQWFRFTFKEQQPKLVYFVLNVTDRDIPLDVRTFFRWAKTMPQARRGALHRRRVLSIK